MESSKGIERPSLNAHTVERMNWSTSVNVKQTYVHFPPTVHMANATSKQDLLETATINMRGQETWKPNGTVVADYQELLGYCLHGVRDICLLHHLFCLYCRPIFQESKIQLGPSETLKSYAIANSLPFPFKVNKNKPGGKEFKDLLQISISQCEATCFFLNTTWHKGDFLSHWRASSLAQTFCQHTSTPCAFSAINNS